jgi:mono/diheme cytochrome c family protein
LPPISASSVDWIRRRRGDSIRRWPTIPKLAAAGYPVLVVVNGSKGMPPFGKLLDDEQVAAVVNYVRSHFGNTYPDSISPADVRLARP